jgi:hypothetical protein
MTANLLRPGTGTIIFVFLAHFFISHITIEMFSIRSSFEHPMESKRAAVSAQQPVWDFAKFAFVMVSFFFYAVVDAVIAFIWRTSWAMAVAVVQILIFIVIECFLFQLYLKGNRSFIMFTNILIGVLGCGSLANLFQAGMMLGENGVHTLTAEVAEAIFFILAGITNLSAVVIHFVVQEKAGRSLEYKSIELSDVSNVNDEPPAVLPTSAEDDEVVQEIERISE